MEIRNLYRSRIATDRHKMRRRNNNMIRNVVIIIFIGLVFWALGHLAQLIGWLPALGILALIIIILFAFKLL